MAKPPKTEVDDTEVQRREIERSLLLLKRQQAILRSRDGFMDFVKFTMPDPADPNDVSKSIYENALHHDAVAAALEEVEKGSYQFLILTMPPRHGKSELVSRRFPAWFMGRHPDWSTVVATYNDDFAMDFGAEVRKIMASPQFKNVFPDTRLTRGGQAKDRLQTTQGGMATFVGVGGSLTGRGAHCFPGDTLVWTTAGQIPIRNLKDVPPSVKVVSYDRRRRTFRTNAVEAFSVRKATRLYRITSAGGRVVEATGDHPFLTPRGYVRADELSPGDRLLCAVQRGGREAELRDDEAHGAGPRGVLLLEQVLGAQAEPQGARRISEAMLRVRGRSTERCEVWLPQSAVLLGSLHGREPGQTQGRDYSQAPQAGVPGVRDAVPSKDAQRSVLQQGLCGQATRPEDVRHGEPRLAARARSGADAAARGQGVSGGSARDSAAGFGRVRGLRLVGPAPRPPHKSESSGQSLAEPDRHVPGMPQGASRQREVILAGEGDVVLRVDEVPVADGGVEVFDIQVSRDHNFFANGIACSNCLIIDDLIKDYEQARSKAFRDRAWEWFTKVAMTRRMGPKLVIITFTRWHQDDIIGRLTDPENEYYNRKLAEKIKVINLPAIAGEDDPLMREPGQALWPDRYDLDFLDEQRTLDPLGFESLYQQRPSLMDGDLFKRETLRFYDPAEINEQELRVYCSSDHAVDTKQRSDYTCLLRVGVDRQLNIYLLDCWWQKQQTDVVVEAMLQLFRQQPAPLVWWAERGHISKSIGPFLRRRMAETGTYGNLVEVTPAVDKTQRAQSIIARAAMGKLFFPKGKPWVERAINEMLSFPNAQHDDFVDALAYIGLGLQSHIPVNSGPSAVKEPRAGTFGWFKAQQKNPAPAGTFGGF